MPLFDTLPDDLFKPLASPARRLHADLLLHLHRKVFAGATEARRRTDLLREIEAFLVSHPQPSPDGEGEVDTGERARSLLARLTDTGWLVEYNERYVRYLDLDPDAALILELLGRIESGETRSYGGAVLGVLSTLESAAHDPEDRSENLRNALIGARDFAAHMRTVSISLRRAEERMIAQPTLQDLFRHFFDEFVQDHLIRDFKTLHTRDNPFRFRSAILREAERIVADEAVTGHLARSYLREGRAGDEGAALDCVLAELAQVAAVFEGCEAHLRAIDETVARIERRMVNTARSMDRVGRSGEAGLIEALQAVAAVPVDEVPVSAALLSRDLPLGPPHIPAPRPEKPAVARTVIAETVRDPAAILYAQAKEEYVRRTRVTAPALARFLERSLAGRSEMRGREIAIASVDDFVAFQRLRELPSIFGGALARSYEFTALPGRCTNDWISCQDFLIRRREGRSAHAA